MNSLLRNRTLAWTNRNTKITRFLREVVYMLSAITLIVASAVFSEISQQLLALSLILGFKWVWVSQNQVIQIFNHE